MRSACLVASVAWSLTVAALGATPGGSADPAPPPAVATPDVIELKDGHQVVGEVIAEKPNLLIIDLGFDVLKIPKDQVTARRKSTEVAKAAGAVVSSADIDPTGFFQTRELKVTPVQELVHRFGEAVISIETPGGKGSGFIINSDGYAVTNHHVIDGETVVSVILYENAVGGGLPRRRRIDDVAIIALNPFTDLALLKIPAQKDMKFANVYLGSLDELNVGDGVFAVGNPLGYERSVSQGIISTKNRNFEGLCYLQTDTAINPGNSGGPLFNLRGEVVGVVNMKSTRGENLGFAIPINYVKDFLRNREAFSFDKDNPNTGHRYLNPPRRTKAGVPPLGANHSRGSGSNGGL